MRNNTYSLFQSNNSFSFVCAACRSGRSKAIPSGMNAAVSPSANHWIMLIASDEWYYSVTPATLMAIHLAPSLPVISQPHVFWERVGGGEGQTGAETCLVHSCIIPSGQRVKVCTCTCSGLCCASAINPGHRSFELSIPTRVRPGAGTHDAKLIISWINAMK